MTQLIELPSGHVTLIDDEDADLVRRYRWFCNGRYACTSIGGRPNRRTLYLHRLIMNAPEGLEVDHINFDKLDNRRANLRLVTRSQNEQNRPAARRGSGTGIRGVYAYKGGGKPYRACVMVNGKTISLGLHKTIEEADQAAKEGRKRYMTHAPESKETT